MISTVFNRLQIGTSDWIHIVPKGELPNREAKIVQVLDDAALDLIIANLNADKQKLGNRWPGLYAGREHWIYNEDKDSSALAWFKDFQKRSDGIWAKADGLTDLGREALNGGKIKFTSFVVNREDLQPLGNNRFRVMAIDTIGFTNMANGKELLTPITNRGEGNNKMENQTLKNKATADAITNRARDLEKRLGLSHEIAFARATNEIAEPITNRVLNGTGRAQEGSVDGPPAELAQARADKILSRARELQKGGMNFDMAFAQATNEITTNPQTAANNETEFGQTQTINEKEFDGVA